MKKRIVLLMCCLLTGCATKEAIMDQKKGLTEYLLYVDSGCKVESHPFHSFNSAFEYDDCYNEEDTNKIKEFATVVYPFYFVNLDSMNANLKVLVNDEVKYSSKEEYESFGIIDHSQVYPYYDKNSLDTVCKYDFDLVEDALPIYVSHSFMVGVKLSKLGGEAPKTDAPFIVEATLSIPVSKDKWEDIHFKAQIMGVLSNCPGTGEMYLEHTALEQLIQDQLGYLPPVEAYILLTNQPNLEQSIDLTSLSQKSYLIQQEWMLSYDETVKNRLDEYNVNHK